MTSDLIVRDAVEADLPVIARIRSRSFGPPPAGDPDWLVRQFERTRDGRMLVVTDAGGEPLGAELREIQPRGRRGDERGGFDDAKPGKQAVHA